MTKIKNEKSWWDKYGWVILLVFIVFVILYVLFDSLKGDAEEESAEERAERKDRLIRRREKLTQLMNLRQKKKKWLDFWFRLAFFGARILIVAFGALCAYSANWYFEGEVGLEKYLTWLAFLTICFSAVIFLFFGIPTDIKETLHQIKPRIRTWVYGKYLGIEDDILFDEKRIVEVDSELEILNG